MPQTSPSKPLWCLSRRTGPSTTCWMDEEICQPQNQWPHRHGMQPNVHHRPQFHPGLRLRQRQARRPRPRSLIPRNQVTNFRLRQHSRHVRLRRASSQHEGQPIGSGHERVQTRGNSCVRVSSARVCGL